MSITTTTVTVFTVHQGPKGGAIFTGKEDSGQWVRIVAEQGKIIRLPIKGEAWRITGTVKRHPRYGDQLHVERAKLLPPRGLLLIRYLTTHPSFRGMGVGQAKISRLYQQFGDHLSELLGQGCVGELSGVLGIKAASKFVAAWRETAGEAAVVAFLDQHNVDPRLANKILSYWPNNTIEKLTENPYRILIMAEWHLVDRLAVSLGVEATDERRLVAAAEASVYNRLDVAKDTLISDNVAKMSIRALLRCSSKGVTDKAVALAVDDGALAGDSEKGYQPVGCALMERYLSERFTQMAQGFQNQLTLFTEETRADVINRIDAFEQREGFTLSVEQRHAVTVAATEPLCVLTGGAGVGKTTVLKAIQHIVEELKARTIQMALAGRAAQRMREATGRDAYTIAGFLNRVRSAKLAVTAGDLIIIDEASMLDLFLAYRIMRALPEGVRLLLVGDPHQLPPIGPGLVFHVMADSSNLRVVELTQIYRQAEATGIPGIARAVRKGEIPSVERFGGPALGVSFLDCKPHLIADHLLDVVSELGGLKDVQILGVTKRGVAGVNEINRAFQQKLTTAKRKLEEWELAEGVPVMYTINDYDRELFNGSLGYIENINPISTSDGNQGEDPVRVICNFDGRLIGITDAELSNLELAYAITAHKAQGSQFKKVVIPITKSRLLDRTLIYTALTRGTEQVVFVGDRQVFDTAIVNPPTALGRRINFTI